jgi:hypothetical protein
LHFARRRSAAQVPAVRAQSKTCAASHQGGLRSAACFDTGQHERASARTYFLQPYADCGVYQTQRGIEKMATHDMEKAKATYESFMGIVKWAVPLIAVIVAFVVMLIA